MNGIQSILALGALAFFALVSLNFNSAILENSTVELENKVILTAFSLSDDLLEKMKAKSFDETTKQFPTTVPSSLTVSALLGPDSGETYANFDDIDDFNGYTDVVSAPHAEDYVRSCRVEYVSGTNPDSTSSVQTFYKKATVTVSSSYMRNPIKLSFIFTLK